MFSTCCPYKFDPNHLTVGPVQTYGPAHIYSINHFNQKTTTSKPLLNYKSSEKFYPVKIYMNTCQICIQFPRKYPNLEFPQIFSRRKE